MANLNLLRKKRFIQICEYIIRYIFRCILGLFLKLTDNDESKIQEHSNFTVILNGGIGDILMARDMIMNLATHGKNIILLIPSHSTIFFERNKNIEIIEYNNQIGFYINIKLILNVLKKNKKNVFLSVNPRLEFILLFLFSGGRYAFGFLEDRRTICGYNISGCSAVRDDLSKHQRYLLLANIVLGDSVSQGFRYQPAGNRIDTNGTQEFIVCAPGKTQLWPAGRWPVDRFAKVLIEFCTVHHCLLKIVGSTDDIDVCNQLEALVKDNLKYENLCGKTSLSSLLNEIEAASLILCNDSGVMHMSAVMQKKCVAIFSFSNPNEFLWGDSVLSSFNPLHSCQPCIPNKAGLLGDNVAFNCPYKSRCDTTVRADMVIKQMEKLYVS